MCQASWCSRLHLSCGLRQTFRYPPISSRPFAGAYSFSIVPYGTHYFLRIPTPPLGGTQLAPQADFLTTNSAAAKFAATPAFVPTAGSNTELPLLIQDIEVSVWTCCHPSFVNFAFAHSIQIQLRGSWPL